MSPRQGRTQRRAMVTLAIVLGVAALPAAAEAAIQIEYVRTGGTVNEGTQMSVAATCPGDMELTGGGAEAGGGYGGVGLNTTFPQSNGTWTAIQHLTPYLLPDQRPGDPNRYQVIIDNMSQPHVDSVAHTAYTVCHTGLDIQERTKQAISRKDRRTSVTARCRPGERVLGGGGLAASLDIYVVESYPIDTKADANTLPDNGWRATLDNLDNFREAVVAKAICAGV